MKDRIIIIDDHTLIRETWAQLINRHEQFEVVAMFGSAEDGIPGIKSGKPALVLLDINLPGMNGIQATKEMRRLYPGIKIIGVSLHNQPAFARQMIKNGARGYLTKSSSTEELFIAFQEVLKGNRYICQEIRDAIANQLSEAANAEPAPLSTREIEIMRLVKEGKTSREIAQELNIRVKTVEAHRYNILKKLKLKNSAALVQYMNSTPSLYLG